jgi:diguanylate cyclase (GGDEF)-like protein
VTAGPASFATAWAREIGRADYVPLLPARRAEIVAGWTDRLADALAADPADLPAVGRFVGVDLVAHGYAAPGVLGGTVRLLQNRLATDLGLPAEAAERVAVLVEALAAGFVEAVRDRTLDAQDAVRMAAWRAHARAEDALREGEARFREFATHDTLTGLPNRTQFSERLAALRGQRLAVCCIDLDRFAAVNDTLGHLMGDRLLVAAAERLRLLAASAGHLVARLDSDQFAILVEGTTCAEDAIKVADRALTAMAEPFSVDGTELPMTACAGIVELAEGLDVGEGPRDLIRAAQIALHWAKADGRASWRLFEPARSTQDSARYRLSAALPAALRRGELIPYYQPLVELDTGRLVGTEALVRWRHPERGLLSAGEFIGLAEDTGLIVPLGEHLLLESCRQAAHWQELVLDPPYVSVNLALRHLQHPGVVGCVAEALDRTGLSPHLLQLELTERAVIDVTGGLTNTLSALAELGVRIALDDFGVGYCNLANLRALPVHRIKLDRTFSRRPRYVDARRDEGFLAATVRLGHTLGLSVTAEGIETADQARRMRAAGCDTGQGWYLGRPMPPEHLTEAIRRSP